MRRVTVLLALVLPASAASADEIRVFLTDESAGVIADELSERRTAIAFTHPDQRRTVLVSNSAGGGWRVWLDPSFTVTGRAYAEAADALNALADGLPRRPPPAWWHRWGTLDGAQTDPRGGIFLRFTEAVSDPRWRFDLDALRRAIDGTPLWPTRTARLDVSVSPESAGLPLPENAVRISTASSPGATRAWAWVWLVVEGGTDAQVRALRVALSHRAFTPLFPPDRLVDAGRRFDAPEAAPPAVVAGHDRADDLPVLHVSNRTYPWRGEGASAVPNPLSVVARTARERAVVLLRERNAWTEDPNAAIVLSVNTTVSFESDAFPFAHPESSPVPHAWPLFGLEFYIELGDDIAGVPGAPDAWELR